MQYPLKLAFGHRARSGKDLSCEYLVRRFENTDRAASVVRIAAPVYELAGAIQSRLKVPIRKDPQLLQWLGMGLREHYHANIWLDIAGERIQELAATQTAIFVPDMRLPNEADYLRANGFILVRIDREDRPIDRDPNHISEIALDDYPYDYIIKNNDSIESLYDSLDKLLSQIQS